MVADPDSMLVYDPLYGPYYVTPPGGGGIPGVSQDPQSGVYCPESDTEWTLLMAAAGLSTGNPLAVYLMQEGSGNLVDSVSGLTLTVAGAGRTYQIPVAGWDRKGISHTDNATSNMISTSASLPNIGTNSGMWLLYLSHDAAPGATRAVSGMGTTNLSHRITSTPRVNIINTVTQATGTNSPTEAVRPVILQMDRTNSVQSLATDQEIISPTFNGAPTGQRIWLGGVGSGGGPVTYLYGAFFANAAAELTTDQKRTLLQTLNWTIPW